MATTDNSNLYNRIEIIRGDITQLGVDCVVNAANERLQAGGGVCGAIFEAAGHASLQVECDQIGGCPTGSVVITKGYALKAPWVIHAVGPRKSGDRTRDSALLASAYRTSLELAAKHQIKSIAFPSISTGIFGFPIEKACRIALETVAQHLATHTFPEKVIFCCFSESDLNSYNQAAAEILKR